MARTKDKTLTLEEKLAQALVPVEEQPYEVPDNWCWTWMHSIAKWSSGGTPSRKTPSYFDGDIPWLKTGELNDDYIYDTEEHITEEAITNSSAKLFPINTIAIAMYGATIGKVGILGIEAATNQACACAVCAPIILHKYLFFYARSQKDTFFRKGKGGAQPNISQDIIKNHFIPLAPLKEQHRIVDRIERLFSELDEAKEKAQAVVDGYEDRRASILHRAFTGELTAHLAQHHATDWQSVSLKDVVTGFKYGSSEKSDYSNSGMPVLRIPNIGEGAIDFSDLKYLEGDTDAVYYVRENDVLIIRSNGSRDLVGKCAIVPATEQQYAYASFLLKIIPSEKVLPEYLVLFLNSSDARVQMFAKAKSSAGIHNINSKELGAIQMPLPETWEQLEIVNTADKLLSKEAAAKSLAERAVAQIDATKQSILARAFRGELGTNDPEDEPALNLLKRTLTNPEV